jgi:hypothetical protein
MEKERLSLNTTTTLRLERPKLAPMNSSSTEEPSTLSSPDKLQEDTRLVELPQEAKTSQLCSLVTSDSGPSSGPSRSSSRTVEQSLPLESLWARTRGQEVSHMLSSPQMLRLRRP